MNEERKNFLERVAVVQKNLKAPKNQRNSFGNYNYRSCEDILSVAKPLCIENNMILKLNDCVEQIGERYYVTATAKLIDILSDCELTSCASAREAVEKRGMDDSQITGATSSYARKYALNALFGIDDTKDADTDAYRKQTDAHKDVPLCADCGGVVFSVLKRDKTPWEVDDMVKYSKKKYKRVLCADCMKKIEKAAKAENAEKKSEEGK